MDTNCAPFVVYFFLFCYDRDFIMSMSDIIEALNSHSRYLDDLLNINNPYFAGRVTQMCPNELKLNKINSTDTEAAFGHLHLLITNGFCFIKN